MMIISKLKELKEEISKEFLIANTVEEEKKLNKLANLVNEMSEIIEDLE